ncbi:MAG: hypothetical protein KJO06_07255, partial [Gemmatimonadetes bacterium]|nr:hypothetical protein [Gemmatimonadota bacterium]
MAVRYDPVLIAGIVDEIRLRCRGQRVLGLSLRRERREVWIPLEKSTGEQDVIGILLHPAAGFVVTADAIPDGAEETDRRIDFRRLYLADVWAPVDERLIVFDLAGGLRDVRADLPPVFRLYVELHTNQWNAVLARGADDRIEAVLWQRSAGGRSLRTGAVYERPEGARAWADSAPDGDEWKTLLVAVPPADRRAVLLRSAAWTSTLNVDWILGAAATDDSDDELARAYDRYAGIRVPTGQAWLLPVAGAQQPYPTAIHPGARRCASLLEGMRIAAAGSALLPPPAEPGVR